MLIYTTCRDCGGPLTVTRDDTVHPTCTPKPTYTERLTQQWLAAVHNDDHEAEALLQKQIDEMDARPPRLREAALAYAGWGWPVFPLKPGTKVPATRNGFKDATTDPDRIRKYWERHPTANVGLPTGHAFDVIDIDVPDGIPTLQWLQNQDRDVHGWVTTASGGTHLYITPTGHPNAARWKPGADYRGAGGYVVAPPSTLGERGRSWSWLHTPSPVITGTDTAHGA